MGRSGAAAGDLLLLMAQNIDVLAGPIISLAYPLYASIRAIETKNVVDDQQWLTYWVLYSMITLFELTFEKLIEWIPYWSYVKLITTCWLVIPQFSGAAYVYHHYIRPFYMGNGTLNVLSKKDMFTPTQDDIVVAADHNHIQGNGAYAYPEIFQRDLQSGIDGDLQSGIDGEMKYRANTFFSEDHGDYVY